MEEDNQRPDTQQAIMKFITESMRVLDHESFEINDNGEGLFIRDKDLQYDGKESPAMIEGGSGC